MALDLRGFMEEPNQWTGLYHVADQLEKRKLRADQLALQQQSRRAAAGTFLQNYLDPKDMLTGTAYDPMIVQGMQAAMQQGAKLAAAGADAPTLMMALGPMVNKLSLYSTNAKTINKQVDEQIKLMRESGLTGYDYSALKDEAMRNAFYKRDKNGAQTLIDPSEIDPSANYVQKAIEANPGKLTTAAGLDLFAKNSPMSKTLYDRQKYTGMGELDRSKVHLIGQTWLTPERDKSGSITDLVPKHDVATEGGQPLIHDFKDEQGKVTRAPVRLLSEDVFDDMMQRRPDIADYIKGVVSQHLGEYKDKSGQAIGINDPKAKMVARAIAYDELNRRKSATIERADIIDKPSPAQISVNVGSTPQALQLVEDKAAASSRGHQSVTGINKPANAIEVFGRVMNNDPEMLQGETIDKNGRQVYDITSIFPGGGLMAGRGANFKYKGIYYNPSERSIIVDKEHTDQFGLHFNQSETIPEKEIGKFIYKIAQSNGISYNQVKGMLEKFGYSKGKFSKALPYSDNSAEKDFENRKTWHKAIKSPFGNSYNNQ